MADVVGLKTRLWIIQRCSHQIRTLNNLSKQLYVLFFCLFIFPSSFVLVLFYFCLFFSLFFFSDNYSESDIVQCLHCEHTSCEFEHLQVPSNAARITFSVTKSKFNVLLLFSSLSFIFIVWVALTWAPLED